MTWTLWLFMVFFFLVACTGAAYYLRETDACPSLVMRCVLVGGFVWMALDLLKTIRRWPWTIPNL